MTARSSLAPYAAAMREPDEVRARAIARAAFHADDSIVLINPRWCRGWAQRQQLIQIAESIHGKPEGRNT